MAVGVAEDEETTEKMKRRTQIQALVFYKKINTGRVTGSVIS